MRDFQYGAQVVRQHLQRDRQQWFHYVKWIKGAICRIQKPLLLATPVAIK